MVPFRNKELPEYRTVRHPDSPFHPVDIGGLESVRDGNRTAFKSSSRRHIGRYSAGFLNCYRCYTHARIVIMSSLLSASCVLAVSLFCDSVLTVPDSLFPSGAASCMTGEVEGDPIYQVTSDSNIVSVLDYSTREIIRSGDNSSEVIQWAIDNTPSSGGAILISQGEYSLVCSGRSTYPPCGYSLIVNNSHPELRLLGEEGTLFRRADGQPADTAMLLVRGSYDEHRLNSTVIDGIEFDGNNESQPSWNDFADVTGIHAHNLTIENCTFHNSPFRACQILRSQAGLLIENCTFIQDTSRGVLLRLETQYGRIIGNTFVGNNSLLFGAVHVNANDDTQIPAEDIKIAGNAFINGSRQLILAGARNCTVNNNSFEYSDGPYAISLVLDLYDAAKSDWMCENNSIHGNLFRNVRSGIALAGNALLRVGSVNNDVFCNTFVSGPDITGERGIIELGYADYNVIRSNAFDGEWIIANITTIGENTEVYDNYEIYEEIPELSNVAFLVVTIACIVMILHYKKRTLTS